jgi:hypothetical protein
MRTSILLTIAAGLFGTAVSAQDTFSDAVAFSLHHAKSDKLHFVAITQPYIAPTTRTADKTVLGTFLIGGVDQKFAFEWSPNTATVPIQSVRDLPISLYVI